MSYEITAFKNNPNRPLMGKLCKELIEHKMKTKREAFMIVCHPQTAKELFNECGHNNVDPTEPSLNLSFMRRRLFRSIDIEEGTFKLG